MQFLRSIILFVACLLVGLNAQASRRLTQKLCHVALGATVEEPTLNPKTPRVDLLDVAFIESRLIAVQGQLFEAVRSQPEVEKGYASLYENLKKRRGDWPTAQAEAAKKPWFGIKVNGSSYSKDEVNAGEDSFWMNQTKRSIVELDQFIQKMKFLVEEDMALSSQWRAIIETGRVDNGALLKGAADSLEASAEAREAALDPRWAQTAQVEHLGIESSQKSQHALNHLQNQLEVQGVARSVIIRDQFIPSLMRIKNDFELLLLF